MLLSEDGKKRLLTRKEKKCPCKNIEILSSSAISQKNHAVVEKNIAALILKTRQVFSKREKSEISNRENFSLSANVIHSHMVFLLQVYTSTCTHFFLCLY